MKTLKNKQLNKDKMLKDILKLVENDFVFEMNLKTLPDSSIYSQDEATKMAMKLGQIYSIAHAIHCQSCQTKYIKK